MSRLEELIKKGIVYLDKYTYCGRTPTGDVQLGMVGEEATIEGYLEACPTPDDW